MSHGEQKESPLLEYHKPEQRRLRLNRAQKNLIFTCSGALAGIVVGLAGYETLGLILAMLTIITGIFVGGVWTFLAARGTNVTEAEEEEAWQQLEAMKRGMLETAKTAYADGPLGRWRWSDLRNSQVAGAPVEIHASGLLTFRSNGQGHYQWERHFAPRASGELEFDFKPTTPGLLLVRFPLLQNDRWVRIRYGFEAKGTREDQLELILFFELDSTPPESLARNWPFDGRFVRSAE